MTPEAQRERCRQAWRLVHLQGWSQRQVATHLGVDQATVSRDLKTLEEALAKEFNEEVELHRARQTMILEHVAQQALQA